MSDHCEVFGEAAGKVLCKCRPFTILQWTVRSESRNAKRLLVVRPLFNHAASPINKTGSSVNEILTALLHGSK